MSKRGENIYKRKDGRWEGRYIKGRKLDGKIQYGYVYASNYISLKDKLLKMKYLYQIEPRNRQLYPGNVKQWLTHWLDTEIKTKVKLSSYASYQYKVEHYILPPLGECLLSQLNSELIQRFVTDLRKQNLSVNTIKTILSIFKQGINSAMEAEYIIENPFDGVKVPSEQKSKVKALSLEAQRQIEEISQKNPNGLPTFLALYTGMRIGEISGLQWSDIDFERDAILVSHTYQRMPLSQGTQKTQLSLSKAKSTSSERMIPLGKTTKNMLLDWRSKTPDSRFVFENNGHPVEPRLLTYHFKKIMTEIGMPDIHFHQLRHTFATRCLEAQENIAVILAILGHNSVKTTLDIYTDALTFQKRTMIQKMENNRLLTK